MSFDRRRFLGASGTFAALVIPGWLAACRETRRVGDADSGAGAPRADDVGALLEHADGRDILVLHVEDDAVRAEDLGQLVGVMLVEGQDDQVAPLAVVDIACRTTAELRAIAPELARADVRAVLLRSDRSMRAAVVGDPPAIVPANDLSLEGRETFEANELERNAWLARQIAAAVGSDAGTLEAQAAEERARLPGPNATSSPAEIAARWPWNARLSAARETDRAPAWNAALARVVRGRLEDSPPAGSTWTYLVGCGTRTWDPPPDRAVRETEARVSVLCGIAFTPVTSRRFLHFYTSEELRG